MTTQTKVAHSLPLLPFVDDSCVMGTRTNGAEELAQTHELPAESFAHTAAHPMAIPARVLTLGCKVNQYEAQFVRELLLANGYRDAVGAEPAALAVVNTCTVTGTSDRKSRQLIYQLARQNPGIRIVVMGCYANADPATVRQLPGVAAVITDKRDLASALAPFGVRHRLQGIRRFAGHQRAFVKVQDGCLFRCSYCIIPKVRPGMTSRPLAEIVAEVRQLVAAGYPEIVLTGIHLGHYGLDLSRGLPKADWVRLSRLVAELAALPGSFRLRLSSLDPPELTDDLLQVMADFPQKVCPHLHLCLQSGSDTVLRRMRRRYSVKRFLERCDRARQLLPQPALTTDVIAGFPGETAAEFADTLAVCRQAEFFKIHAFPFSARKNTDAADYPDQLPPPIIQERVAALAAVEQESAPAYLGNLIGKRLEMLVQGPNTDRPGWSKGMACRFVTLHLPHHVPHLTSRLLPVQVDRVVLADLAAPVLEVSPCPDSWQQAEHVRDLADPLPPLPV